MLNYTIVDNAGNAHKLQGSSDTEILATLKTRYVDYIASVLSGDSIVVYRPNGYILAYINTATGEQTVKSMSDWVGEDQSDDEPTEETNDEAQSDDEPTEETNDEAQSDDEPMYERNVTMLNYTVSGFTFLEELEIKTALRQFFLGSEVSSLLKKCNMLVGRSQDFTYDEITIIISALRSALNYYDANPTSFNIDFITACDNAMKKFKIALRSEETNDDEPTEETNDEAQSDDEPTKETNDEAQSDDEPMYERNIEYVVSFFFDSGREYQVFCETDDLMFMFSPSVISPYVNIKNSFYINVFNLIEPGEKIKGINVRRYYPDFDLPF